MCCFLQTMIMLSIIVNLSCLPVYLYFFLSPLSFISPPLFWQPCGCDSRERRAAGRLASSWSQHHLPTASRVRLHHQQEWREVENAGAHIRKDCSALTVSLTTSHSSLTPVSTWWLSAPCLWPSCSSARPSCHRHAPYGRQTTTSWF